MLSVAVLSATGIPLMPTTSYRARKLLKRHSAVIEKYRPIFTIRLTNRVSGETQPVEYKCDTGYANIGISIASESKEYVNEQRDMLTNEPERHNDRSKYRRTRRNRKRHRAARFDNRKGMICKDGFAPSIRNKRDLHVALCERYAKVIPITKVVFEMGQFDTQLLKAMAEGKPSPEGTDYQRGEQYGYATLREAVFTRDGYRCQICGKSAFGDEAILCIHHIGYLHEDRTNRMSNLLTVCTKCHTSANHKKDGKLYGLTPKLNKFTGATFMTSVRWSMYNQLRETLPEAAVETTYGAATKETRKHLNTQKTHANDAWCMGSFHPKHRAEFVQYKKQRRNNRILEKFYDAKYTDIRDGKQKSGGQLSCNRTNRREVRNSEKNERIFRVHKTAKGRRSIRRTRYSIQAGDTVSFRRNTYICHGCMSGGKSVLLMSAKESPTGKAITAAPKNIILKYHTNGWRLISP